MSAPYPEILAIVRTSTDLRQAFDALRDLGKSRLPTKHWDKIRTPYVEVDLLDITRWMTAMIADRRSPGIYLGMYAGGDEFHNNLEIGFSDSADPEQLSREWLYDLDYPDNSKHRIEGLAEVARRCAKVGFTDATKSFADEIFYVGYGGALLATVIERLPHTHNRLYAWGLHEHAYGFLAKATPTSISRIAQLE